MASPYDNPVRTSGDTLKGCTFSLKALLGMVLGISLVLGGCAYLLRARRNAQIEAWEYSCRGGMNKLAMGLRDYHSAHGALPEAIVFDLNGKPMHSWRAHAELQFDRCDYDLSQPWNAPRNAAIVASKLYIPFQCSASRNRFPGTDYIAVVGPETAFDYCRTSSLNSLPDGRANTVLVIEQFNTGITWSEPRDLSLEELMELYRNGEYGVGGYPHRPALLFADWEIYRFQSLPTEAEFRALFTANGNDGITRDELLRRGVLIRGGCSVSEAAKSHDPRER